MSAPVVDTGQQEGNLVKFESVEEVGYFLAHRFAWDCLPTMAQMLLYRREDGAYFCALEKCEVAAPAQDKADQMVTLGPLVFCKTHGQEVHKFLLKEMWADRNSEKECRFYFLSKTIHNAETADERAASGAKVDNTEDRRAKWATDEIAGRWGHLGGSREWGPRHAAYVEHQKAQEQATREEATRRRAAEAQSAGPASAPHVDPTPTLIPADAVVRMEAAEREALQMEIERVNEKLRKIADLREDMGVQAYAQTVINLLQQRRAAENKLILDSRREELAKLQGRWNQEDAERMEERKAEDKELRVMLGTTSVAPAADEDDDAVVEVGADQIVGDEPVRSTPAPLATVGEAVLRTARERFEELRGRFSDLAAQKRPHLATMQSRANELGLIFNSPKEHDSGLENDPAFKEALMAYRALGSAQRPLWEQMEKLADRHGFQMPVMPASNGERTGKTERGPSRDERETRKLRKRAADADLRIEMRGASGGGGGGGKRGKSRR